jgi:hypothetical protein
MDLAYLDAGSGSMLIAAVVAGFSGATVAVRVWFRRVTSKFRRSQPTEVDTQVSAPAETDR